MSERYPRFVLPEERHIVAMGGRRLAPEAGMHVSFSELFHQLREREALVALFAVPGGTDAPAIDTERELAQWLHLARAKVWRLLGFYAVPASKVWRDV